MSNFYSLAERYWNMETKYQVESICDSGDDNAELYNKLLKNKELSRELYAKVFDSIVDDAYLWEQINNTMTEIIDDFVLDHKEEL